jgi:RNA polymerase sigma-70 factor
MHRSLARIRAHSDFRDETLQCLRERLFVGAAPKIKAYAARGPLSGWLRRAALNVCFNLKPSGHDKSELETTLGSSIPCDVEFSIAKQRLVAQVALDDAAARLSVAQRELLRLHAHGWCIDQLASLGGKHRSTVGRSLAAIRMQLAGEVIEKFHGHFEMSRTEARWALGQLCDDLDARALLSLPSCVGG